MANTDRTVQTSNKTTKKNAPPEQVNREDLTIDPEFQELFSANAPEKGRDELKEDIRKRGILDKLIGWEWEGRKILLDGHTRFKIHEELDIKEPLPIQWLSFEDRNAAMMWMLQHQFIRRNLNLFQRIEAALKFKDYYTEKARINQDAGVRLKSDEGVDVLAEVAKLAKTSRDTAWKVAKILEKKKDKEVTKSINLLRNGDPHVSIHSVYVEATRKKRGENNQPTPSKGLKGKIDSKVKHFTALVSEFVSEFPEKSDGIYIYDTMIKWARGKKAELKAPQKLRKKPTKKTTKREAKKTSKK